MASPARRAALSVLGEQRRRRAYARDLLRSSSVVSALEPRDRALAERLVLGVVAASGSLDLIIDAHLRRPTHVEPICRDALRLATFELCHLATPAPVAVSQGVALVGSVAPHATGLANAVLRRIAEEDRPRVDAACVATAAGTASNRELALAAGMPEWLAARLVSSCGDAVGPLLSSQLEPAPVYVAANVALRAPDEAFAVLEGAGLDPAPTQLPGSFVLGAPARLAASGLVEAGDVVVCDLAAQLVCRVAAPAPGESLLEVGQGRGTKTILLLSDSLLGGDPAGAPAARVTSLDCSPSKVRLARRRIERGWEGRATNLVLDGRALAGPDLPREVDVTFDRVLVDAPCSGTGTLRRHPEIVWSLEPEALDPSDPESLPALQLALLEAASARVREGGELVYSTCSLMCEEDEDVVARFLEGDAGRCFSVGSPLGSWGVDVLGDEGRALVEGCVTNEGYLRTVPTALGCDGHFCARLVRS